MNERQRPMVLLNNGNIIDLDSIWRIRPIIESSNWVVLYEGLGDKRDFENFDTKEQQTERILQLLELCNVEVLSKKN